MHPMYQAPLAPPQVQQPPQPPQPQQQLPGVDARIDGPKQATELPKPDVDTGSNSPAAAAAGSAEKPGDAKLEESKKN